MSNLNKEEIMDKVTDIEWEMMQDTKNAEGVLDCQKDKKMFKLQRESHFCTWSESLLYQYYEELLQHKADKENVVSYKYAYMMENTSPLEYMGIKDRLPEVSEKKLNIIEELWDIEKKWAEELSVDYPYLMALSRPINSTDDNVLTTSIETYFKGELKTYGESLLENLLSFYKEADNKGINLHKISNEYTFKKQGCNNLEQAEKLAKEHYKKNEK